MKTYNVKIKIKDITTVGSRKLINFLFDKFEDELGELAQKEVKELEEDK